MDKGIDGRDGLTVWLVVDQAANEVVVGRLVTIGPAMRPVMGGRPAAVTDAVRRRRRRGLHHAECGVWAHVIINGFTSRALFTGGPPAPALP